MKTWLKALRALIWKDLLHEWRSREMLTAMLAFAVLVEDGRSGGSVAAPIARSFLDLYRAAPTAE